METGPNVFFTDVRDHLQALDLSLQGQNKIVSDLAQTIFSFMNKSKLFQRDINTKSLLYLKDLSVLKRIYVQKR